MKKLTVVKVGGKVVEDTVQLTDFLKSFSKIEGLKLLVHGGGRLATDMASRLGMEVKIFEGRRITDKATLEIAIMIYGGLVNKNIVAALQSIGITSIGLVGADLNLMQAVKRKVTEIDYGFVGDITGVNTEKLKILISMDVVPVIAPLTHDNNGQLLNTNADTVAAEIAVALSKDFSTELVFCFEKPGVCLDSNDEGSLISSLDLFTFKNLQKNGAIHDGMIPKLDNSFNAIKRGVHKVRITNTVGILTGGTTLLP